jgi:predicted nucleic-acid-binding protein
MTIGLDTSVVLRLLTGEPDSQARAALQWLRQTKASGTLLVVSDLVASEVYFALQHHFGVSKIDALHHLNQFLASGDVVADGAISSVLETPGLASAKPGFVDRLIHAHYVSGGAAGMATFEKAARSLPDVTVLDGMDCR